MLTSRLKVKENFFIVERKEEPCENLAKELGT